MLREERGKSKGKKRKEKKRSTSRKKEEQGVRSSMANSWTQTRPDHTKKPTPPKKPTTLVMTHSSEKPTTRTERKKGDQGEGGQTQGEDEKNAPRWEQTNGQQENEKG